ncbi:MAG: cadherin domain-containing protein, partial [Daejeonella sp.]
MSSIIKKVFNITKVSNIVIFLCFLGVLGIEKAQAVSGSDISIYKVPATKKKLINNAPTYPFSTTFYVNDPPIFYTSTTQPATEGEPLVAVLFAADPEGGSVEYEIVGGVDASKFQITGTNNNRLEFVSPPDYESFADSDNNNKYLVRIRASDLEGNFSEINIEVQLINLAPSIPTDANGAANTIAENSSTNTLVGITASSADPAGGAAATYTLTNNAGGRFQINSNTGVVSVLNGALINYENATSHIITVRASDPSNASSTQSFTVTVTDVNETPLITSNSGGLEAYLSIPENTTTVTT